MSFIKTNILVDKKKCTRFFLTDTKSYRYFSVIRNVNKYINLTFPSTASQEALDRARLSRERREAEQRKRLDELRAHAAAAQAQREKRDEDRRRRQAEQRAKDDERRLQVRGVLIRVTMTY